MIKRMGSLTIGMLAGVLALPAFADFDPLIFHDCTVAGIDRIYARDAALAEKVFVARNGDEGIGNGGESVDIISVGFTATSVTCVSTADEDTGGSLTVGSNVFSPSVFAPEYDPGTDLLIF